MADAAAAAQAAEMEPTASETDEGTIAGRTRTKFSLVDVPIDTLEASLPDTAQTAPDTEEDREYQRFLSSLLPTEQENLSFLDEEDEEYRPEEEEDDHEDEDTRRGISKKELTDLLLDSTNMTFPKLPVALEPARDNVMAVDTRDAVLPVAASADVTAAGPTRKLPVMMNLPVLRGQQGAVTQAQCIQLASQMHKHLQLLLQSYHLLAGRPPTPELAECRAMIEELQQRGDKALKYKNALLSKLNPLTTGGTGASMDAEGASDDKAPPIVDGTAGDNGGSASTTENLLALRRVTRSLTAAHAAMAHPSMFELVGSQTVDELSAGFARGCSIEERDRAIQEQMLQLDKHLMSVKKRCKSKKMYSATEDNLLAHGVKRFGTQADSWGQIQKHLLPTKTTQNLRHRYKYLISAKTGMSAVKALHMKETPQHRGSGWLLEEDLRIARGLVELHKEKYHFARLAKRYLPHRSRLEIRKRWERIAAKFRSELAEIGLDAPDDDSLDLAVAMKEYLEDKLRNRMLRQRGEAERAKLDAALQLHQLGQGIRATIAGQFVRKPFSNGLDLLSGIPNLDADAQKNISDAASCRTKNLHPALFFSSWSFISPATLLNSTCKHNWPSFMDEGADGKDKPQKSQPNDASIVADIEVPQLTHVGGQPLSLGSETMPELLPIEMPSDLAVTPTTELAQAGITLDFNMGQKEGEDEEEDDDSDYEHDELLSSENEESESDFEQMELTDDDDEEADEDGDDEASVDTFDQDTFMSDSDDQSVESVNSLRTPISSPQSSPSHTGSVPPSQPSNGSGNPSRLHHPLRLQNLGQPGNERMKRALAALERRIVGKSINGSASSSVASTQMGSNQRAKRKMVSTLVAPLGAGRAKADTAFQASGDEPVRAAVTSTGSDGNDDDDDGHWEDGSGDEDFEVVEISSSSDGFPLASSDKDLETGLPRRPASVVTTPRRASISNCNAPPNKKAKLQQCPTCRHTLCTCTSSERMQLLLRRMKEKRSSSSLQ
ncbi:hypothetical protein KRP22_001331 [Phytophthora ramorum]|nr:hypothetical protein KRP22_7260 [Phytophthora ramorum]